MKEQCWTFHGVVHVSVAVSLNSYEMLYNHEKQQPSGTPVSVYFPPLHIIQSKCNLKLNEMRNMISPGLSAQNISSENPQAEY